MMMSVKASAFRCNAFCFQGAGRAEESWLHKLPLGPSTRAHSEEEEAAQAASQQWADTDLETYEHRYLRTYLPPYGGTHVHIYLRTYINAYMYMRINTGVAMYVYICIYVYMYIHTYIHTYIRTYLHKYILTYIRTYIRTGSLHGNRGVPPDPHSIKA